MINSFHKAFNTASIPILMADASGKIIWINDYFNSRIGALPPHTGEGSGWPFVTADDKNTFTSTIGRAIKGDPADAFNTPMYYLDGTIRNIRWNTMLIPHDGRPGGEIVVISGVEMNFFADSRTDINALEERYRTLFENIGVGMLCIAEDTTIALVNREFEKITGYTKEQVEGKMSWIEFIKDEENLAKMKQYHTIRRIDPDTAPGVYDTKFETATGKILDVIVRVAMIPGTAYSIGSILDITQRKLTEEKFMQVFMMAPDGISITRIEDGMIIDTNVAFEEMLGWKRSEVIGRTSLDINFWDDPDDRIFMANEMKAGREIHQRECRFRRKDDSHGIGLYSSKPIQIAGDECLIFIMQDITARRMAEERSRQSEEKFTKIFMLSPDCIAITRVSDGMIIDVNVGFEEITGWTRNEATGRTSIDISFWAGLDQRERMITDLQAGREIKHREFQFRRKDGSVREGIYSARTIRISGEECLIFILTDVTEIMETEKILKKNEQRLHGITTNIPGVVYQFYMKNNGEEGMTYVSEKITDIFGLPGNLESIYQSFLSRVYQEDTERFINSIRFAQEKVSPWNFEGRFMKPSGEMMWFKCLSTPTKDKDRIVFDGILLDITEQKLAEEKSRQSEEKFTKVFMTTPDCIVITRLKDGKIMDVNRGFEEISGWKTHEVIGRTAMEIKVWNDLTERDNMVNDLKADLDVLNRESRFRRKDGSFRNVIYSARSINIAGDDCIIFVLQDITNLKEAERSLRSSLDEKELLIKELYHRTKNNMQVISGLLKLKSAGTDDQEIHGLFTDIETRIQTMALVHQKLYESQNLTDLNLHDFINSFAELITRNYALVPEKISIRQSVDSIPISIDVAMPLSLVLNELISNSLKHAFHGERHGEILIKIESAGENLKFEYRDNGIGLPEGFEPSVSATLGMNIIHTISKNQLGGEIIFLKGKGFGCIINIKTNLYRRRI